MYFKELKAISYALKHKNELHNLSSFAEVEIKKGCSIGASYVIKTIGDELSISKGARTFSDLASNFKDNRQRIQSMFSKDARHIWRQGVTGVNRFEERGIVQKFRVVT